MNKIEEKHYSKISGIPKNLINVINPLESDAHVKTAKECAAVTEEVSVKFAEWMIDNGYKRTKGKIYWVNDVEPSLYRTETELFHHPDFLATL